MKNLNTVVLGGNLVQDVSTITTMNGKIKSLIRMAVNTVYGSREEALFINVQSWGSLAESCNKNLSKGDSIIVEGRLKQRNYSKDNGQKITLIEVVADNIIFVNVKKFKERK